jgi:hypothetical protein
MYDPDGKLASFESRHVGTFDNLAAGAGLSVRHCLLAAETGRLGEIVRVYVRRRATPSGSSLSQPLSGAVALARIRQRMAGPAE